MKTTNKALPPCDAGWSVANRISDDYADGPGADRPETPPSKFTDLLKFLGHKNACI
jgi:hypothetical protein